MTRVLVFSLLPVAWAGAAQLTCGRGTAAPGGTAPLEVRFTAQGSAVTGAQFDLEFESSLRVSATLGPAGASASKTLTSFDLDSGRKRFLIAGLNQSPFGDGVLVSLAIALPQQAGVNSYQLRITNSAATDKDGKAVSIQSSDGSVTVSGGSEEASPLAGTIAQFATGGSWKTTFTLMNLGTSPAAVKVNFWGDDGRATSLPVAVLTTGAAVPATTATVEQTIAPGGVSIFESEASRAEPTLQGWAELLAPATVTGFAVFRQRVQEGKDNEAVVPLETRSASSFVLTFDNVGGFATGIAVANTSGRPASLSVTIRDESGAQIGADVLPLASRGHTAFVLTERYRSLTSRRGSIEFQQAGGGSGMSVLGLRFNPYGSFTSIPVLVR